MPGNQLVRSILIDGDRIYVGTYEDFGYFSRKAPGCYFQLGTADPQWPERWHSHTPQFRISEEALPLAATLYAKIVLDFLEGK